MNSVQQFSTVERSFSIMRHLNNSSDIPQLFAQLESIPAIAFTGNHLATEWGLSIIKDLDSILLLSAEARESCDPVIKAAGFAVNCEATELRLAVRTSRDIAYIKEHWDSLIQSTLVMCDSINPRTTRLCEISLTGS